MDGGDGGRRWKNIKQRLGFKGMGCCGPSWILTESNMSIEEDHHEERELILGVGQISASSANLGRIPAASGMNLAAALAAERNLQGPATNGPVKTLMRLIEETDGVDLISKKRNDREEEGFDGVCCVCMERNKGAAFVPCGHTFCRVCSREVWVNRGSCPICNRLIIEILDIF